MAMVKKIMMMLFTVILVLTAGLVPALPVAADGEQQPIIYSSYASTSPAIDGVISPGEWGSPSVTKTLIYSPSVIQETHDMNVYFMNDHSDLYVAITVADEDFAGETHQTGLNADVIELYFDNNNNDVIEINEDIKNFWNLVYNDYFVSSAGPSTWSWRGDVPGGTLDGEGIAAHSNHDGTGDYTYEFKIPLNSGDIYDLSVDAGSTIGIKILYREMSRDSLEGYWSFSGEDGWPGSGGRFDGLTYGKLVLASGTGAYGLTMAVDPYGSGTAADLTGESPYEESAEVTIEAVAAAGYRFINWTAPAGAFDDATAATTNFTMPGQSVTVTANFVAETYEIRNWNDLYAIRFKPFGNYLLMNNLDSTSAYYTELAGETANDGKGWQPIGMFEGTFDGQEYEIRSLFINRADEDTIGLFGYVGPGGVIENIGLVDASVTGHTYVGGLIGYNSGTVRYSYAAGNVTGNQYAGGLVGINYEGNLSESCAAGNVTGNQFAGGLVGGISEGTVSDSYAAGNVTGNQYAGGLVGDNWEGAVDRTYSTGNVTGTDWVGGLVGRNLGTVSNSFWDTETSGMEASAGGTGKTTEQMKDIATFMDTVTEGLDEPWDIIAVGVGETNGSHTWNIIHTQTYPFLSWERAGGGGGGGSTQYELTINSTEGGSVLTPGEGIFSYNSGTAVSLLAIAEEGYEFVAWTGDVATVTDVNSSDTYIIMNSDHSITASFKSVYNLILAVSPYGSGTAADLTGGSPYQEGAEVTIEAAAAAGYRFVNWTAPAGTFDDATAATTNFTMPGQSVTVTANFELLPGPTHKLTLAVAPYGSGTAADLTGLSYYPQGAVVYIKAEAAEGCRFVNWTAPAGIIVSPTYLITAFIMPGQSVTVTANFETIPTYNLIIDSTEGGSVTVPGEGIFTYEEGTVVGLVAMAAEGYRFTGWTGDVGTIADVDAAITNIIMNSTYNITANFEPIPIYNLIIDSTEGGTVTVPGEGIFSYPEGTVVDLVAVAAYGYKFTGWTGDVGTIADVDAAITAITMNDIYYITANFEPATYKLTMAVEPAGSGTAADLTGLSYYPEGAVVSIEAEAAEGCWFVKWTAPAGIFDNATAATTSFTMPDQDVTVTANFITDIQEIHDWYDLHAVRNNLGGGYLLMNDLDYTSDGYTELASMTANEGKGWQPIGTSAYADGFTGFFDGQGYEIRDWLIDRPDENYVGLFGYISSGGVIRNVVIKNASVTGYGYVGGLAGIAYDGSISNSYAAAIVTGETQNIGGLAGYNYLGSISNSQAMGAVLGGSYIGGLVGRNSGTISNSSATGNVTGNYWVGGLVGHNDDGGIISDSYATGKLLGNLSVGGLVGNNDGVVLDSHATGAVTGEGNVGSPVGGLAGYNSGTIENSQALGTVTGNDTVGGLVGINWEGGSISSSHATGVVMGYSGGGLVGYNWGVSSISDSYAIGDVIGSYDVGGLVGTLDGGTISNSHATGAVTGNMNVGGLVGGAYELQGVSSISDSYAIGDVIGTYDVGGLVGSNLGSTISNSHATGAVKGTSDVGGLGGYNSGTISNSHATGAVIGTSDVGGLVGNNWEGGSISNCYAAGAITGRSNLGGLVGNNRGTILRSYAKGSVTGEDYIGGLVGSHYGAISNSYATGAVTSVLEYPYSPDYIGGLVGYYGEGSSILNSYSPRDRAGVVDFKADTVTDGTIDAKAEADTEVEVSGTATIIIANFIINPGGEPPAGLTSLDKYIDVYIPVIDDVTEAKIKLHYSDTEISALGISEESLTGVATSGVSEESLRLLWWDGEHWLGCSDSGVNTSDIDGYSGYIRAIITEDTTPNLAQLTGTPFGVYSSPTPVQYDLTINSTEGGSVTVPGEGTFSYTEGAVVDLVAEADTGFRFFNWTAPAGTFDDATAATTNFTMPGQSVTITANFVPATTVEVNSGNTITLEPGGSQSDIPVMIKNIPVPSLSAYQLDLSWNKDIVYVDSVTTASISGFLTDVGVPDNLTGTVTVTGFSLGDEYPTGDVIVVNLNISAVGNPGDATAINVFIETLVDENGADIPAMVVGAPVQIINLVTETGIFIEKDTDGIIVVSMNVTRIKDPATGETVDIPGGIGSFMASATVTPESGMQFLDVRPFGVIPDPVTGIFSGVLSPPVNPPGTLAKLVSILSGNCTTSYTLNIAVEDIVAAGDPGVHVTEEHSNSITFLRGDATNNGKVDILDAMYIAQYIVKKKTLEQINGLNAASVKHDTGGDKIDILDAMYIAQYIVKKRDAYFNLK